MKKAQLLSMSILIPLTVGLSACGEDTSSTRPEGRGEGPTAPAEWAPYEEEGVAAVVVEALSLTGRVGPYALSTRQARSEGMAYGEGALEALYLQAIADVDEEHAALVALSVSGDLDDPGLLEGRTFFTDDAGDEDELFVLGMGCAGEEDSWDEFDAVADEVDLQVKPVDEESGAVQLNYTLRFFDDFYGSHEIRGETVFTVAR